MGLKATSVASKVSVRTDGDGILSMNFMIEVEGKNVFVEFRVSSYLIEVENRFLRMWRIARVMMNDIGIVVALHFHNNLDALLWF
jgi:Repair protein Rad1/Rec1/Rad17